MHPFPSCLSQIPIIIQHTRTVQVNSDPGSRASARLSPSPAVAVSAGHVPALTSKQAGCVTFQWQVHLETAIQLQCLMPVIGAACSFWGSFENQPSSNGKHLLTQHGVYFPLMPFRLVLKLILHFGYVMARVLSGLG